MDLRREFTIPRKFRAAAAHRHYAANAPYAPAYTPKEKELSDLRVANRSSAKRAGQTDPGNEEQKHPDRLALIISRFLKLRHRGSQTHK